MIKKFMPSSILIAFGITFLYGFSTNSKGDDFKILSTSYSRPLTEIQIFENSKLVNTKEYKIAGVERISDSMIFDKYGDTIIDLKTRNKRIYSIEENPLNIKKFESGSISLNNSNINEFSITKYDHSFKKSQNTMYFKGVARDFIIDDDNVYVLANIYGDKTRDVTIYILDLNTLKLKKSQKIKNLEYAFYFKKINNQLNIYGNLTEKNEELAISVYDINKNTNKVSIYSKEPVMWVSKIKRYSKHKEILLNAYSLLEVNYQTKKVKVLYQPSNSLIDFRYSDIEKCYYILEGNFDKKTFKVTKLNKNMKIIKIFPLKRQKYMVPSRILL